MFRPGVIKLSDSNVFRPGVIKLSDVLRPGVIKLSDVLRPGVIKLSLKRVQTWSNKTLTQTCSDLE